MPGIQTINLGTAGTQSGDIVRDAFEKCNNNFSYLDDVKITGSNRGHFPTIKELFFVDAGAGKAELHAITDDGVEWKCEALFLKV